MRLQAYLPLTQYGEKSPLSEDEFRNEPRRDMGETYMSLILGDVDACAASVLIRKYVARDSLRRGTAVGTLRKEKFTVEYSPEEGHRLHVSVFAPQGSAWGSDVAERFRACFTEAEGIEGGD